MRTNNKYQVGPPVQMKIAGEYCWYHEDAYLRDMPDEVCLPLTLLRNHHKIRCQGQVEHPAFKNSLTRRCEMQARAFLNG